MAQAPVLFAHVFGFPAEETLGMASPAVLTAMWALAATFRARLRRRPAGRADALPAESGGADAPAEEIARGYERMLEAAAQLVRDADGEAGTHDRR
jgi:hypothetical protein